MPPTVELEARVAVSGVGRGTNQDRPPAPAGTSSETRSVSSQNNSQAAQSLGGGSQHHMTPSAQMVGGSQLHQLAAGACF